jgi:hypothetical protein
VITRRHGNFPDGDFGTGTASEYPDRNRADPSTNAQHSPCIRLIHVLACGKAILGGS